MKQLDTIALVMLVFASAAIAAPDGLELAVSPGPMPDSVHLEWAGGQPLFRVYRSHDPANLVDPMNLIVQTSDANWTDANAVLPPGDMFHYRTQGACGNGTLEAGEECDDGNVDGGDGCSPVCTDEGPLCGDFVIDYEFGETCDPPGDPAGNLGNICRDDCTFCGDGWVDPDELCDPGDFNDPGCSADCTLPTCGDGILDVHLGEACDPPGYPAGGNGNLCRDDCTVCGDGIVDVTEECDDGNGIDTDDCRNDCTINE